MALLVAWGDPLWRLPVPSPRGKQHPPSTSCSDQPSSSGCCLLPMAAGQMWFRDENVRCYKHFDQESYMCEPDRLRQEQGTVNILVEIPHFDQCSPNFDTRDDAKQTCSITNCISFRGSVYTQTFPQYCRRVWVFTPKS